MIPRPALANALANALSPALAAALALMPLPALAQTASQLAPALVACWQARGVHFAAAAVAQRIGSATGKAALVAVAGATESADGEGVETAVEIVWEAGQSPPASDSLLQRDLARGLPLIAITADGRTLLLHALADGMASLANPVTGQREQLALAAISLIGRPVIAGA